MVGEYSFGGNENDNNDTPAFKFDQFETYDGHPVHSRNKRARTAFGASPNKYAQTPLFLMFRGSPDVKIVMSTFDLLSDLIEF